MIIFVRGEIPLVSVSESNFEEIAQDKKKLYKALAITSTEYGSFCPLSSNPLILVYNHPAQVKNSSVGVRMWDEITTITMVPTSVDVHSSTEFDLDPFFMDNFALNQLYAMSTSRCAARACP